MARFASMSPRRWRRALLVVLLPFLAAFGPDDAPLPENDEGEPLPEESQPLALQALSVVVQLPGRSLHAGLEAPADWVPLAASSSRAELVGPDRRSRLYLRAMPAVPQGKSCSALARDYAREVIRSWGAPPRSRVVDRTVLGSEVTFELARRDPLPDGELVLGRVFCQEGVLVVATCAGPAGGDSILRPLCRSALSSVHLADEAVALAR